VTSRERAPRGGGVVRNIIHLGLGQAATTVVTILLTVAMARTLGPSEFGQLYLLISIATFTYVVVDWGHGPYIVRETARHPERSGDLLGSALAARVAGALLACPIAVATTWLLGYDVRTRVLTAALILGWLPQYLGLSFGWVFRSHGRMDSDAVLNVVLKLVTLIGSVVCLALGGRLPGLVLAWLLAGCLTLVIAVGMYQRLGLPRLSVTMSTVRELLRDGAWLLAISLGSAIEPYVNANILYKMASPTVVGWYGAAWNIAGTLLAPATILGATMYPRLSRADGDGAEFKRAFDLSFRPLMLLAVLCAVGTYLFADVAVGAIYGLQKFGPAAETLRALGPVLLLMYVDVFLATAAVAAGKAGRVATTKAAAVVFTTGIAYVLIPLCQTRFGNGGLGVVYALGIGELGMLVACGILIRHAIDGRTVAEVFRSLIAGAATVLLIRMSPAFTPFLAIPICIVVFGGVALLVGAVRRSDIELLMTSFRKPSAV
jgi:O-antigen/teichoic acid export membrane protein